MDEDKEIIDTINNLSPEGKRTAIEILKKLVISESSVKNDKPDAILH